MEPLEILANRSIGQTQFSWVLQYFIILGIVGLEGKENSRLITESNRSKEFLKAKMLDCKGGQLPSGVEGNLDIEVRLVEVGEGCLESGVQGRGCVYCSRGSGGRGLGGCAGGGVWWVVVAVTGAAGVGVTALARAEVAGWGAVVPAVTAEFLAAGLFTIVCSCC